MAQDRREEIRRRAKKVRLELTEAEVFELEWAIAGELARTANGSPTDITDKLCRNQQLVRLLAEVQGKKRL